MVSTGVRWSARAAGSFGIVSVPLMIFPGLLIAAFPLREDATALAILFFIPLSAMATGGALWYLVVERWGPNPVISGAMVGAVTGLLSHFVFWVLFAILQATGVRSVPPDIAPLEPTSVSNVLRVALEATRSSVRYFGWVSVPFGVVAGVAVGYRRKWSH